MVSPPTLGYVHLGYASWPLDRFPKKQKTILMRVFGVPCEYLQSRKWNTASPMKLGASGEFQEPDQLHHETAQHLGQHQRTKATKTQTFNTKETSKKQESNNHPPNRDIL